MTPLLLFYYLLSVAGGVLAIGFAGLLVMAVFFVMVGSNRRPSILTPTTTGSGAPTIEVGQTEAPTIGVIA